MGSSRVRGWWRSLSTFDKVRAALALSMVALFAAGMAWLLVDGLVSHLALARAGEACAEHRDCRSEVCLRVSAYQPLTGADFEGLGELGAQMAESMNEAFDPLAEGKTGWRTAAIAEAYCTEPCETDRDCPGEMACGEVRTFEQRPFSDLFAGEHEMVLEGAGEPQRYCVRAAP